MMLYSIVTVVYNDVSNIERTILSVLSQDYGGLEYIVIDGGSTDGTMEVVDRYADRIAHIVSEKDGGIYDAMNKGAALASGKWINFMNSGDTFVSPRVLSALSEAASGDDYDVIYGNIMADGEIRMAGTEHKKHRMFFCHQSAFVRTEIVKRLRFDTRRRMSADFKFFRQCSQAGFRFFHAGIPVAVFDTGGISNRRRVAGLADNARVVAEVERGTARVKNVARLWFSIIYLSAVNLFRKRH